MEIFVLLMVTHRAENGEWVVNCCLNSAVKGLQLVDLSSMSLGDTSKHSLSMRLPSTLSVVLFGQEDRKLGSSGARIGTTVDCELVNEVVERGANSSSNLACVNSPTSAQGLFECETQTGSVASYLIGDLVRASCDVIGRVELEGVELFLRSRQLLSTTGEVSA